MRPVDRGPLPQENGVDKTVADYKDWRMDLLGRLGNYCCYCNMVLNDSPQVEHVTPKNPQPGQPIGALLAWDNMLLACGPCNRAKGNKPNTGATHYLPDYHNTHLAFDYVVVNHPTERNTKACIPIPKNHINVNNDKALRTIELCSLSDVTLKKRATDLRWKYRFEAWSSANALWRDQWDKWGHGKSLEFIALLLDAATTKGFFSIWFEAFHDVPAVRQALIQAFPGTHSGSFDVDFNPQLRVAADL